MKARLRERLPWEPGHQPRQVTICREPGLPVCRRDHAGTAVDRRGEPREHRGLRLEERARLGGIRNLEDEALSGCGLQQDVLIALAGKRPRRSLETVVLADEVS